MSEWAGIVTYNPSVERLRENLKAIVDQVERVILFDNGSDNIRSIDSILNDYKNVSVVKSCENIGLASALNSICKIASENNIDWILLLDQDTVCGDKFIETYYKYELLPKAAILCPIMFDKRRRVYVHKECGDYKEICECIQSGALYNVKVLEEVGYFDDWYFIDYIDYDYCMSIRRHGYKIYQVSSLLIDQEASTIEKNVFSSFFMNLANITKIQFFAMLSYRPVVGNLRSYYTARNRIYYIYKNRDMLNVKKEIFKAHLSNIRNVLRVKDHFGTFKAVVDGVKDGEKKVKEMGWK